jgi:type VI secretion system protein ImpL
MSNVSEGELNARLAPHVRYYLKLLKGGRAAGIRQNADLVARARQALMNVPVRKRYYDLFVTSLAEEKLREDGDETRANRRYPSVNLHELFLDRPDVLKVITSASQQRGKGWREVEGPYTERGHYAVLKKMADGAALLERDQWIVPLTVEERPDRIPQNLRRLADDYERQYIEQWSAWLTDLTVPPPTTVKDAIAIYKTLAEQEWPYLRILRQVEDHTQWKKTPDMLEAAGAVASKVGPLDIKKLGERVSTIPDVFKRTVEFAVPAPGSQGAAVDTPLARYIDAIEGLRRRMEKEEESTPGVAPRQLNEPLEGVRKVASALLQPLDEKGKTWLTPLLLGPLQIVSPEPPSGAPGASQGGASPGGASPGGAGPRAP